jgi:hypothetical protein
MRRNADQRFSAFTCVVARCAKQPFGCCLFHLYIDISPLWLQIGDSVSSEAEESRAAVVTTYSSCGSMWLDTWSTTYCTEYCIIWVLYSVDRLAREPAGRMYMCRTKYKYGVRCTVVTTLLALHGQLQQRFSPIRLVPEERHGFQHGPSLQRNKKKPPLRSTQPAHFPCRRIVFHLDGARGIPKSTARRGLRILYR